MRVVATSGHVDHGKSTLLRAITGMEPDRWAEEKRRGLSIDLGFVWKQFDGPDGPLLVAFVDVPGHQRFLGNMLAGVGAVENALLVVAADDGWSAQTEEHVEILDLLQVRGVLVAVTKSEQVDESQLETVIADVRARLIGTALAEAPILPVDSVSGRGIAQLIETLLLRLATTPVRDISSGTRLWIDRSFSIPGSGTVVTGTLHGDAIVVGQDLRHAATGRMLRVRGIQALGETVANAAHGTRVALNLARITQDEIGRGHALLSAAWETTRSIDVMVRSVSDQPIARYGAWQLHVGSVSLPVRIHPLLGAIGFAEVGPARLEFDQLLPLRHGDRFVLRSMGHQSTVGGGAVLDPAPGSRPRGVDARLDAAEQLESLDQAATMQQAVRALLHLHGGVIPRRQVEATFGRAALAADDIGIDELGSSWVLSEVLQHWEQAGLEYAREAPPDRGVYTSGLVGVLRGAGCPASLERQLLDHLVRRARLDSHGDIFTVPATTARYIEARVSRQSEVLEAMARRPLEPPSLPQVAQEVGIDGSELQSLFEAGRLVQVGDVVFSSEAVAAAVRLLQVRFGDRRFTAGEARDAWDTTRKYAVPLLDHLVRTRVTVFDGEAHQLLAGGS